MSLNEDQIRVIAQIAREELGDGATYDRLQAIVRRVVDELQKPDAPPLRPEPRADVLVICLSLDAGRNGAALSDGLKDSGCVIRDRVERGLGGYHTLLCTVDRRGSAEDLDALRKRLADAGNRHGVRVLLQTEEVLRK